MHYYNTMGDYKIKKETEVEVGKTDTEEELEDAEIGRASCRERV